MLASNLSAVLVAIQQGRTMIVLPFLFALLVAQSDKRKKLLEIILWSPK